MIHLHTMRHWSISRISNKCIFFKNLDLIIPFGSVLYFASHKKNFELSRCLQGFLPKEINGDIDSNIWEVHAVFNENLKGVLDHLFWEDAGVLNFDHVHCYHHDEMLFWFHDGFTGGELVVSPNVSGEKIRKFCYKIGSQFELLEPIA